MSPQFRSSPKGFYQQEQSGAMLSASGQSDWKPILEDGPWEPLVACQSRGLTYWVGAVNRTADAINWDFRQHFLQRDRAARSILLVRGLRRALQYQLRHTTR